MKTGKPAESIGTGGQPVRAYLDRETIDRARQLGNGNFSLGLRRAIKGDTQMIYVNAWFSPRGFANEGTNYYGTLQDWRAFIARLDPDPAVSRWCISSQHRSLDAAQAAAEKEVGQSRKRRAWGEQDYTQAERLPAAA